MREIARLVEADPVRDLLHGQPGVLEVLAGEAVAHLVEDLLVAGTFIGELLAQRMYVLQMLTENSMVAGDYDTGIESAERLRALAS